MESPVLACAERLREHGSYLFFRHRRHFHDPLVPAQWARIRNDPALQERAVLRVLGRLAEGAEELPTGIYSPVPIARALAEGVPEAEAIDRFRYELVCVDERQRWSWQGRPVADRLRDFFLEHLGWESTYPLWFFEYRVSDEWFDKCYLDCVVSPLKLIELSDSSGQLRGRLQNGRSVEVRADGFELDEEERLYARTEKLGPALFSEALRFRVLSKSRDDLRAVEMGGTWIPLHWPESE